MDLIFWIFWNCFFMVRVSFFRGFDFLDDSLKNVCRVV